MAHTAYVETPSGIYKEVDGVMSGPFSREEVGITPDAFVPGCQTLRCGFSEGVSLSFGFGYGNRADNTFAR